MRRLVLISGVVAAILSSPALGQSCDQAYRAVIEDGDAINLSQAVAACSDISDRLNNLAFWLEKQGRPVAAEKLYRRALAAPGATIIPYAGLGDALRTQGKIKDAIKAFAIFLKGLDAEALRGDPHGISGYRQTYIDRLKSALDVDGRGNENPNFIIAGLCLMMRTRTAKRLGNSLSGLRPRRPLLPAFADQCLEFAHKLPSLLALIRTSDKYSLG